MGAVESLRQPEYTGENRCVPCTVVNVGIAAALAAAMWALLPAAGVVVFGAAVVVIYLRGYLVPGTPTLTKRYLPASVLRLFGKTPLADHTPRSIDPDTPVEEWLFEAGALTDAAEPELTENFAAAWRATIEETTLEGIDDDAIRALLGTEDISRHAETSVVVDGTQSVQWISRGALVADAAAADIFRSRVETWCELSPGDRITLFRRLRLFLERCPACGEAVATEERTVDPCCERPHTLIDVVCEDCTTPLADAAVAGVDEETSGRVQALRN